MKTLQPRSGLLAVLIPLLLGGCAHVENVETAGRQNGSQAETLDETAVTASSPSISLGESSPSGAQRGSARTPREEEIEYGQFSQDMLTRVILAELAGQRGYNRQALEEYVSLARESGNISLIRRASRIAAFLRDVPVSLEMSDLWIAQEPDSAEARQILALQMTGLGRYREAMQHMTWLVEMGEPADFRMLTSRMLTDRGASLFIEPLTTDLEGLAARFPANQDLRLALAHLYQQDDQLRRALETVRGLGPEMQNDPDVVILEVQLLESMGESRQAQRRLQQSLDAHPDDGQLRFLYARSLIQQESYDKARAQFAILVDQDPQDYDMLYSLALLNMELDRIEDARGNFERLLENPARRDDAHYYLAYIAEQENDDERAIEHYKQVNGGGNFLEAQRKLTELLVAQDRYPEARERLQRVRLSNSDYNIPLITMEASVLMDLQRFDEADLLLDGAVGAFPNNVQLLYLRSVLSQEVDDLVTMEKDLRKIIELNPESPVAYNSLGYILADRTQRYDEAYELIKKAIALAPDDPAIIDSLGWVQYRLGMYEEARRNLDRAFELYPDHEVAAHLGEVLWVLGEKDEASRVWRDALRQQPDSEPVRDAIRRLNPNSSI